MREHEDIEQTMSVFGSTVWRVCLGYFRSQHDAQDAFQETFIKYAQADSTSFDDDEHRKAWLIRVASNACKDMLRSRKREDGLADALAAQEALAPTQASDAPDSLVHDVLDAFRALDDPPRLPLYLSIYEGYSAPEIASMLDVPVNTVYSWISRGKKALREVLS